jgi:hypothetical protein
VASEPSSANLTSRLAEGEVCVKHVEFLMLNEVVHILTTLLQKIKTSKGGCDVSLAAQRDSPAQFPSLVFSDSLAGGMNYDLAATVPAGRLLNHCFAAQHT